jgi:L-ribulose-5-phosphate 3-epimerase UlaE
MSKPLLIGVIQGRLLPKFQKRYQAHPLGYWQHEFQIAAELGLDCIEFILDHNDVQINPLMSPSGLQEVQKYVAESGVVVKSICADYFMQFPLHTTDDNVTMSSLDILCQLIGSLSQLGTSDIVIPCVEDASIATASNMARFIHNITPAIKLAEQKKIRLSLETDLNPHSFCDLLEAIDSDYVTVNYDTGNSAALGYDPKEELAAYGEKITDIHIKDRKLNGGPVVLGSGNTNFTSFFKALKKTCYSGPFIMQAYRDDEGVEIFRQQLNWIKPWLRELNE